MADELPIPPQPPAPKPAPKPADAGSMWTPRNVLITLIAVSQFAFWSLVAYQATRSGTPIPAPPVVPIFVPAPPSEEPIQTFGWVPDPAEVRAVVAGENLPNFGDTPAGKAVLGDDDSFLWRAVLKANKGVYPNVNQRDVGCCVGCGFKHACDVVQGVQIAGGGRFEFKPVSAEVIYGGSRVEIGGSKISGDGSVGAWAFKWLKDFGVVAMAAHPGVDLSVFSPARARQFGRGGVPDSLEPIARQFPVKGGAAVRSWLDVKRAIQQGYPVAVCSNVGFRMERDRDGFLTPQGQWAHCMCLIGTRGGNRTGAFCLNSWGDTAHPGPRWPEDAPAAGFWIDANVVERMVSQGDSYALSDLAGFPARKVDLDWNVRHNPPRDDVFVLRSIRGIR